MELETITIQELFSDSSKVADRISERARIVALAESTEFGNHLREHHLARFGDVAIQWAQEDEYSRLVTEHTNSIEMGYANEAHSIVPGLTALIMNAETKKVPLKVKGLVGNEKNGHLYRIENTRDIAGEDVSLYGLRLTTGFFRAPEKLSQVSSDSVYLWPKSIQRGKYLYEDGGFQNFRVDEVLRIEGFNGELWQNPNSPAPREWSRV